MQPLAALIFHSKARETSSIHARRMGNAAHHP
jgi:hypothetical protein